MSVTIGGGKIDSTFLQLLASKSGMSSLHFLDNDSSDLTSLHVFDSLFTTGAESDAKIDFFSFNLSLIMGLQLPKK